MTEITSDGPAVLTWEKGCKPWLAASDDDTRPVLQTVHFGKGGYLYATNTCLLAVVKADFPAEYVGCCVKADFFKMAARFKKSSIVFDGEQLVVGTPFGEMRARLDREMKFPNVANVLKGLGKSGDTSNLHLNPRLLSLCAAVLGMPNDHYNSGVFITQENSKGHSACIITRHNVKESFCALMPRQFDGGVPGRVLALLNATVRQTSPEEAP